MFLISLNYIKPISEVERILPEHIIFLNKYYNSGNFIFSGRKEPRIGGLILAVAQNLEAMNKIIEEDPFFKNGIAKYEVTEFKTTKNTDDFSKFFDISNK
ncbi:YciI family protein [Fusobacterium polymorphum]|uniref:YciI family protein n=1 Tax=Fusobacterium nucleatum subsp. polymorphum TaxID=76857 RepID=UPI003009BE2D